MNCSGSFFKGSACRVCESCKSIIEEIGRKTDSTKLAEENRDFIASFATIFELEKRLQEMSYKLGLAIGGLKRIQSVYPEINGVTELIERLESDRRLVK